MSHVVTITTEIRDAAAVRAACDRLRLPEPVHGRHRLFSGEVVGLAVELSDWRYPVVCDLSTGQAQYDNYEGRWGPRNASTSSFSAIQSKNAASRRESAGTLSPSKPWPTARSSLSWASKGGPYETDNRDHRRAYW